MRIVRGPLCGISGYLKTSENGQEDEKFVEESEFRRARDWKMVGEL